ncbi:luciferin 4-monooxygenase [Rhipicephalus sanguineus]|uniref:luciferin 4-monooxygenase n=1 Tax=Rhipicephalus sanguineus TaxID=34632 RepID=UPI0020C1FF15|nr:luciferin 4-monooxygenase [Rhipicephalus sanguineus]
MPAPGLVEELTSTFQLDELRTSYGMTEAGGCMTLSPKGDKSCNNVGFPIPGTRMKIINPESSNILGPMQCGEVLFDTPYAALRYCGHPEATATITDEQGWIHTGDLGYYDHDGRLFLCGRLKTMILCQRRRVSPVTIEHCLIEHTAVQEVAVIGVPAPDGDEFPAAVVITKPGYSQDHQLADDLKRHVAERKPSCMHLHGGVYFADALPKNALGKARSASLRELLGKLRRMDSADETASGNVMY